MSAQGAPSVTSIRAMAAEEDEPRGGDELDEEGPSKPFVHPDDRLWRHPSEVASGAGLPYAGGAPSRRWPFGRLNLGRRWSRLGGGQVLVVGVVAGLVGALAAVGILSAAGMDLGRAQPSLSANRSRTTSTVRAPSTGASLTALIDGVGPSVVQVDVSGAQGEVLGSGVFVGSSGQECYVVTADTLLTQAGPNSQVQITDYWGATTSGRTIGTDAEAGIAVIEVNLPPCSSDAATVGTVASTQAGEPVIAVGSAAVAASVGGPDFSTGYLGGTQSYVQPASGAGDGLYSVLVAQLPLGPSGAGDAVVDSSGNLLGIAYPAPASSGVPQLTYLMPIDIAMADVTAMVKGAPAPSHPWFGVVDANDMSGPGAAHLGVPGAVQVEGVAPGSPAARAGIRDGDVLTSLGGPVPSVGALVAWMAGAAPGRVCRVSWVHDGKHHSANIILGVQPPSTQVS